VTNELDPLDRQRARWRRARERLRLVDPDELGFASRGLVRRVEQPGVRLLILPEDPERWLIDFDDEFWAWWRGDQPDPSSNQPARWGGYFQATSDAAVRSSLIYPNTPWRDYIALHRCGALEVELGAFGASDANVERASGGRIRVFRRSCPVKCGL
jgi:hypothetical protein